VRVFIFAHEVIQQTPERFPGRAWPEEAYESWIDEVSFVCTLVRVFVFAHAMIQQTPEDYPVRAIGIYVWLFP
jgi:hypothetical protein